MLKNLIHRTLPLLTAGTLLAASPVLASPLMAGEPQAQSQTAAAGASSSYSYTSFDGSYAPGTWKDIVTVPHIGLFRVVITTHWFGYQTGYWVYHAFRGENAAALSIKLVDSYTYNNPTVPELAWNGWTLHWRWSPITTNGGPTITVTAENMASDFAPTFY